MKVTCKKTGKDVTSKVIKMLEKLNQLAEELFQTLNFNTCNCEQQEIILQEFVSRGYYLVSAH